MIECLEWEFLLFDDNRSASDLENMIKEHGVDDNNSILIRFLTGRYLYQPFSVLSKEKIDLIFKYKPKLYEYKSFQGVDYLKFIFSSDYTILNILDHPRHVVINSNFFYIWLKLLENMELNILIGSKISVKEFKKCYNLNIQHMMENFNLHACFIDGRIYAESILDYVKTINLFVIFKFNYVYLPISLLIENEIERKISFSNIIIEQINNFK